MTKHQIERIADARTSGADLGIQVLILEQLERIGNALERIAGEKENNGMKSKQIGTI